ncbi:MAG: IS200/IS605 family transposase [Bacteroidetes bacterium]|nr:IS200/IS605 family transposase [Bacteroidota bacterium]
MPQSLANVLVHVIFSTKNRYPFLSDINIRNEMHAYLGGTINNLNSQVILVGGSTDHVHILCKLSRNYSIAKVVGDIKRSSSKWIKTKGRMLAKFEWQNGYGAFSVGKSETNRLEKYILNQEIHHSKKSFQDEFRLFLQAYQIEYDERYVWD